MNARCLLVVASLLLTGTVAADAQVAQGGAGTWDIGAQRRNIAGQRDTVDLSLRDGNSSHGFGIAWEQLEGLSAAGLAAGGPVQFRMRRDAGTFHFEGIARSGVGAGTYTFAPSASFPTELARRGFTRPTAAEQYQLARNDIGFAFLDELVAQRYARPADLASLLRAADHGVSLTYVREMGRLGYRLGNVDGLITLRDHGVSAQFVRDLATYGLGSLSAAELVRARDHGVSAGYLRDLGAEGYTRLSLDTLIQLRDHGVSPEYVRGLRERGYATLPVETLVRLRNHGVSPGEIEQLAAIGYRRLSIDELIALRNHGLSPERVRSINARAGTTLPVNSLTAFASRGWR